MPASAEAHGLGSALTVLVRPTNADLDSPVPEGLNKQLHRQLTALGCTPVGPVDLSEVPALLVDSGIRPVVVIDSRTVAHEHALRMLVRDDRDDTVVLPDTITGVAIGARFSSRITSRLTALPHGVTLAQLVTSISRHSELSKRILAIGDLVAAVPDDGAGAVGITAALARAEATGGEEAIRLRQSVKRLDNPIASHLIGPWARHLGRWLLSKRVSPDAVTVTSLLLALLSSAAVCLGTRTGYVLGSVGIMASFALDCTDGQMARYAVRFSSVGGWLDAFGDRVKEQMFLAGLAIGGVRAALPAVDDSHLASLWWLAAAAGGVTLVRHFVGFGYTHAMGLPSAPPVPSGELTRLARLRFDLRKIAMLPFGERTLLLCILAIVSGPRLAFWGVIVLGGLATLGMVAGRVRRTARGSSAGRPTAVAAEVAAEVAATSVAALSDVGFVGSSARSALARLAFRSVPGAVVLAFVPAGAGVTFVAVSAWRGSGLDAWLAASLLIASALWWAIVGAPLAVAPRGWLAWLLPSLTSVVELLVVLGATFTIRGDVARPVLLGGATFALLAMVALHRYGREYSLGLAGGGSDGVWTKVALGHEGRSVVVAVLAGLGLVVSASVPGAGVWVVAGVVGVVVVAASAAELGAAIGVHRARS